MVLDISRQRTASSNTLTTTILSIGNVCSTYLVLNYINAFEVAKKFPK